jgi:GTP-binding protein HflX
MTAGLFVAGHATQRLDHPNPATFIGSGKVEEVALALLETEADVVVFDDELSPRHQRELEEAFGEEVKLLDRTALILDIFAQHASTREGALQVELAQYEYRLPRLTRAWTHLARQAGGRAGGATGGVGLRGPGETQLETDRRVIGRRISKLKEELEAVRAHRQRYRARRRRSGVPTAAIVGYTNAGKSTLLNALAHADVLVANQLFATLDPTTRRVLLPNGGMVLFTDTVGFIQKLPTELVAAFRATLEEVAEADVLLHVVDVTHRQLEGQVEAVLNTLDEIGAGDKPVVTALNKIDRLTSLEGLPILLADLPNSVAVSALKGQGLDRLLERVEVVLESEMAQVDVVIPYEAGELVSLFHRTGTIELEEHTGTGTHIRGRVPRTLAGRFEDVELGGQSLG